MKFNYDLNGYGWPMGLLKLTLKGLSFVQVI
jgi:hypothetical protein